MSGQQIALLQIGPPARIRFMFAKLEITPRLVYCEIAMGTRKDWK
ncbi:hypothetical protein N826_37055 [Skermanella aerolata KACC 11604]|nr:hypothetical protein N826_37055 [Skermanella aerolata KACC 11604]